MNKKHTHTQTVFKGSLVCCVFVFIDLGWYNSKGMRLPFRGYHLFCTCTVFRQPPSLYYVWMFDGDCVKLREKKHTSVSSRLFIHPEEIQPHGSNQLWRQNMWSCTNSVCTGSHVVRNTCFCCFFFKSAFFVLFSGYFRPFPQSEVMFHRFDLHLSGRKHTQAPKAHFPPAIEQRRRDDTEKSLILRDSNAEPDSPGWILIFGNSPHDFHGILNTSSSAFYLFLSGLHIHFPSWAS